MKSCFLGLFAFTLAACGEDGASTTTSDAGAQPDVQACLDECGDGCPAPDDQLCASDGELYCNECVIECHGLTVEDDATCEDVTPVDDVDACLEECGVGCPAPDEQPCASDGNQYCSECVIECHGLTVESDAVCEVDSGTPAPTETDAGASDGGIPDPAEADAAVPDGGTPGPTETDAAAPDSGMPPPAEGDAAVPDGGASDPFDLQACFNECGVGCPAPDEQPCASDGSRYCSACVIACHGLTVEPDAVCDADGGVPDPRP